MKKIEVVDKINSLILNLFFYFSSLFISFFFLLYFPFLAFFLKLSGTNNSLLRF